MKIKKRTTTRSWTSAVSLSMAVMSVAALSMVVLSMSGCSMFVIYLSMILSISCLNHHLFSTYCPDLDERWKVRV